MSAEIFLGASLGAFVVALVWLWFYIRHACDDLSCPDTHAIPPEIIERARLAAVLEYRERDQMREQS